MQEFDNINGLYSVCDSKSRELVRSMTTNIFDFVQYIEGYPNVDLNEADWSNALNEAIKSATSNTGTPATIFFPSYGNGEYKLKPFSLIGYNNLRLLGGGAEIHKNNHYLWDDETKPTKYVRLHFISHGEVGIKTASTENPYTSDTQYCHGITIENLWLYGANNVETVVNGNYDFTLKNCRISHGLQSCVTLEDYTYPCLIQECNFGPSSGHGIYVRGPMTTTFTINECNANLNNGYGYYFEGGSYATIKDCLSQSNKQGGLMINHRNDLYKGNDLFSNLLFINFYTENNGLYQVANTAYDGNYAFVIKRTGSPDTGKPYEARDIKFIGGSLEHSNNGKALNIDSAYGLYFENVSCNTSTNLCNYNECQGLYFGNRATYIENIPYPWRTTLARNFNGQAYSFKNEHVINKKGHVYTLAGVKENLSGSGEETLFIDGGTDRNNVVSTAYPIKGGSVIGMKIVSNAKGGKFTLSVVGQPIATIGDGLRFQEIPKLTLDAPNNYNEIYFDFLEYPYTEPTALGIRLSWENITGSFVGCKCYLIVED